MSKIVIPEEFKGPRPGKFFAESWDWFAGIKKEHFYGWAEFGIACLDIRFINLEMDPEEYEERLHRWTGEKED